MAAHATHIKCNKVVQPQEVHVPDIKPQQMRKVLVGIEMGKG